MGGLLLVGSLLSLLSLLSLSLSHSQRHCYTFLFVLCAFGRYWSLSVSISVVRDSFAFLHSSTFVVLIILTIRRSSMNEDAQRCSYLSIIYSSISIYLSISIRIYASIDLFSYLSMHPSIVMCLVFPVTLTGGSDDDCIVFDIEMKSHPFRWLIVPNTGANADNVW